MSNNINHPSHYNMLPIECIDVIQYFDFISGSIIKYVWRYQYKGKALEDLKKAKWYLEYLIAQHEDKNVIYNSDSSTFNYDYGVKE